MHVQFLVPTYQYVGMNYLSNMHFYIPVYKKVLIDSEKRKKEIDSNFYLLVSG